MTMAVESMENDDDSDDGGIGPLPGGLTNYCPSVLDTVGWVI